MARFERGENAFGAREPVECGERLVVGDADVARASTVLEERMLGTDARVVEAGRDRMRLGDLAVVVAQHVGAVAVQHAGTAGRERGRVASAFDAFSRGFRTDDAYLAVVEERVEQA